MPVTFDPSSRRVTARVPERDGARCQFRWRTQAAAGAPDNPWQTLADSGDTRETWVIGNEAATLDIEALMIYADGGITEWAPFCVPLKVPAYSNVLFGVVADCLSLIHI